MSSLKENLVTLVRPDRISEMLGLLAGGVAAPVLATGTLLRQNRVFHPRGVFFRAEVEAIAAPRFAEVAQGLAQGETLTRFSAGLSSSTRGVLPDVLGVALRFNTAADADFAPQERSQDLLMVTSQSVLELPLAALKTEQRDFLANVYYGMGKYEVGEGSNMRLRLVPLTNPAISGSNRYDQLRNAVSSGEVVFELQAGAGFRPSQWDALVRIRLVEEVALEDDATAFWPFRVGQGIRPEGFVQYLRPLPYLASQWVRDRLF